MKAVVYIKKNQLWVDGHLYDWHEQDLGDVLSKIKRETKVDVARFVLGNDLSYVTSMKMDNEVINREKVLRMARSQMPFPIDGECFDWKEKELVPGEKWLQLIAIERYFLEDLSAAVVKSGIKVELVTAIGILLAEKTVGREAPVVLKWTGKEKLFVVAINGLADMVTADISEDDLVIYTKQKWALAVNPEVVNYSEKDINVAAITLAERTKGEDRLVLNLPILRDIVNERGGFDEVGTGKTVSKKIHNRNWIVWVVFLILAVTAVIFTARITGLWRTFEVDKKEPEAVSTETTPSLTETPEPTMVDLSGYKVQILNGSGIVGGAAKMKTVLQEIGFVTIDIGNTVATSESDIRMKAALPSRVMDMVIEGVGNDDFKQGSVLAEDDKYDLIIVLGK